MYRLKMLFINLLLCGGVGFLMQFMWILISGRWSDFNPQAVLGMVFLSGIIGTICMFAVFFVTLSVKTTWIAVTAINMAICLALLILIYVLTGIAYNIWALDLKWLIILLLSETTTFLLTRHWYEKICYYNSRLDRKKESLSDRSST
jgi:hypothetical protein